MEVWLKTLQFVPIIANKQEVRPTEIFASKNLLQIKMKRKVWLFGFFITFKAQNVV
jgi:hypothetical protein